MNKISILLFIALFGILVPTYGQVVNYGDSNYMAVRYEPNPPLTPCGDMGSALCFTTILAGPKDCVQH